jgi:hypothetical protein
MDTATMRGYRRRGVRGPGRQSGVALAVGLMLLLVLTVIGIGAMRSSLMELQMARNEESRSSSFQRAQSLIDATLSNTSNMIVSGAVGDVTCQQKDIGKRASPSSNACTAGSVTLLADLIAAPHDVRSSVFVERLSPEFTPAPRGLGFSVDFDAAQFQIDSEYDARTAKLGRSALAQGVMVIVKASQ